MFERKRRNKKHGESEEEFDFTAGEMDAPDADEAMSAIDAALEEDDRQQQIKREKQEQSAMRRLREAVRGCGCF